MEDRLTDTLYLEMTDATASNYAGGRVPAVLATPGVRRATWGGNVNRNRRDLPRKLPQFALLGVYEADSTFVPPPPSADLTGAHPFPPTPRPGQGSLSGRPTIGLSLVLVSPRTADGAQALRDWADFVHIRHIAATANPGYTMTTPYEHATGGDPRFMHFYETDTDEPESAYPAMTKRVMERLGGGPGT